MKPNDVIAVIVIILFLILAGIAFGIYKLKQFARGIGGTSSSGTGTSSTGSESIADHQ